MSTIVFWMGTLLSACMGALDFYNIISVPNWVDWVPFGIGTTVALVANAGAAILDGFCDIIGSIIEAILD